MEAKNIRVLLVDDHAIARNGVSLMLGTASDICVAAQAASFDDATERISSEEFDVALVDIAMPGKSGLQLLQMLRLSRPRMPVVVLSHYSEEVYGLRALHLGAAGYLTKDVSADVLVQAVRKVGSGGKYVSAAMAERLGVLVAQGPLVAHEELSERLRFLSEQKDDLEGTLASLREAIARINRTSRQRFRETFDLVSKHFSENFPRLFGGGKASLELTDSEDILEAGVDIMAMPPGKRLQNVNLLSGGEKTMTALALLVAVFQVRPSPFFLLDEVDAALDDANVGRFNQLITEMSSQSQFLVITHNKRTIEVADMLYGVTMEQKGVSKLVSVVLK